jgi:Arc/MetJ-type ribon-helix-helix transcriptional regulator
VDTRRLAEQVVGLVANAQRHVSRSEAIRRAIELYLYRLACEGDAARYEEVPLTAADVAMADDPGSWEGTPEW